MIFYLFSPFDGPPSFMKFCYCLQRFAGSIGNKVEGRGEVEHWCVYKSGNVRVPLSCLRRRKIIDGGKFSVISVNKIGGARK